MKTIRMTAIRTEKARSRTQDSALHTPTGTRGPEGRPTGASGAEMGGWFSCIPLLLRQYRRFSLRFGCLHFNAAYFKSDARTGRGTAPSLRARSLNSDRL